MTPIIVIKRSSYAQRRYERRGAFLAQKRQEAEQRCQSRSLRTIFSSIFNKKHNSLNRNQSLTFNRNVMNRVDKALLIIRRTVVYPSIDNCCLPKVALYSSFSSRYRKSGRIYS